MPFAPTRCLPGVSITVVGSRTGSAGMRLTQMTGPNEGDIMTTTETEWAQWHAERERYFGDPLGWVSITGLHWLGEDFERVADLPGRWRADAEAVYIDGVPGVRRLEPVEGAPGLFVQDGERRIEVIRRTGSVALRVHDPASPRLAAYRGI